jgi:hypothetical protein
MFTYPPQIYLDNEDELANFLDQQLEIHRAERGTLVENLIRWQHDYWAEPPEGKKTFPFVGAANIIIPLTAIAVESVHARMMTTAFALEQFIELKLSDKFDDIDSDLERYIDKELKTGCNIEAAASNASLEFVKFGTAIMKTGWERSVKNLVRYEDDERTTFQHVVQGAVIDAVPLANFIMPFADLDPQKAGWCGEEHTSTPYQIEVMEASGMLREGTYQKLRQWVTMTSRNTGDKYRTEVQEMQDSNPVMPSTLGWVEVWLAWDTDKSFLDSNGTKKEIVVLYHQQSRTFMSIRYNWFNDGRRPYRKEVYFPLEHRWNGIGICKQNEQFQRQITTQHRQRLDNATLANMRMIKVSKMSGYGPNEPVFPGKMWFVDNKDDIETFQLGEIYPSSYNNEAQSLSYAQQRSGVNEVNLGMPQAGTPGTATAELARVQEGSRKFDYSYRNFRNLLRTVSKDTVKNIAQFGFRDAEVFDYIPKGDLIQQFFKLPYRFFENETIFDLQLAGQNQNKILNRQNWMQLAQIIQQYYTGIMEIGGMMGDPRIVQAMSQQALIGSSHAFRQILETYDTRQIDKLVLDMPKLMQLVQAMPPQPQLPSGTEEPAQQ